MNYLHTDETTISDFDPDFIDAMYQKGYVFTRIDRGVMHQTRSVRIDLSTFEPSSENRRILKKTEGINLSEVALPLSTYEWGIGKMAKDFYATKFGTQVMSAQKIKEMCTDATKSNFNTMLTFSYTDASPIGYSICHRTNNTLHYSYPFYDLQHAPKDMGLGMIIRAIIYAKENGLTHIYLGSLQRASDTYKLQFAGLEWFDGQKWSTDLEIAKTLLKSISNPS